VVELADGKIIKNGSFIEVVGKSSKHGS